MCSSVCVFCVCVCVCVCVVGERLVSLPGSGVLVTGGEVRVGLSWGVDEEEEGRVMCPPGLETAREPSPNMANLASLRKWAGS